MPHPIPDNEDRRRLAEKLRMKFLPPPARKHSISTYASVHTHQLKLTCEIKRREASIKSCTSNSTVNIIVTLLAVFVRFGLKKKNPPPSDSAGVVESRNPPGVVESRNPPGVFVSRNPPGVFVSRNPPGVFVSRNPPGVFVSRNPPGVFAFRNPPGVLVFRITPGVLQSFRMCADCDDARDEAREEQARDAAREDMKSSSTSSEPVSSAKTPAILTPSPVTRNTTHRDARAHTRTRTYARAHTHTHIKTDTDNLRG